MASHNLNLCLYPMPIQWFDVEANLENLESSLESIHPQTDLLILPETFATGFPSNAEKEGIHHILKETEVDLILERIKFWANKYNIAIVGSLIMPDGENFSNRGFFIEPTGDEYFADKKHLFTLAGEDKIFSSGKKRLNVRYRGWNISLIICYDVRFPVWCRNKNNEYDLLIAVANWPASRVGAWEKLLPARAIENECYVAGVNCIGTDNFGFEYDGSSMVVDFKGESIGVSSDKFIYATLDHSKLMRFREKFPAWKDADNFTIHN